MVTRIGNSEVEQHLSRDAQLLDVLPANEYREKRLPGAINIPLTELNRQTARQLDPTSPVIVYCRGGL